MKCKKIQQEINLRLQNKKKQKLKEKGITLIALVVTIIILLILVGVTISQISGENGLIGKAKEARKAQIIGETKEAIGLEITEAYTEATLRREELEKKQVEDIVNKYGKLQEDGDTIITEKDGYKISLKEIYSGVLSESGSYRAKVEQIEMLEKELENLKQLSGKTFYKELGQDELNVGQVKNYTINFSEFRGYENLTTDSFLYLFSHCQGYESAWPVFENKSYNSSNGELKFSVKIYSNRSEGFNRYKICIVVK